MRKPSRLFISTFLIMPTPSGGSESADDIARLLERAPASGAIDGTGEETTCVPEGFRELSRRSAHHVIVAAPGRKSVVSRDGTSVELLQSREQRATCGARAVGLGERAGRGHTPLLRCTTTGIMQRCVMHRACSPLHALVAQQNACAGGRGEVVICRSCSGRSLSAASRHIWDSGPTCMVIATLFFGLGSFWVKLLNGRLTVFQVVFVRSALSWLVTYGIRWRGQARPMYGDRKNYPMLASRGLFGATAMTLFYASIQLLPLGDAVSIFFSNATATSVAAYLFGYEQASWFIVAGCIVNTGVALEPSAAPCDDWIGGVVIIAQPPFLFGGEAWSVSRIWGVVAGTTSAVCAAGAFLSLRAIGDNEKSMTTALWFHAIAACSTIPPLCLALPSAAVWPSVREWGLLFGIAVTSFWGQLLLARGFQTLSASSAAAINLLQVVHAHILSVLFLHDSLQWQSLLGSACICAGAVLVHTREPSLWAHSPAAPERSGHVAPALEMGNVFLLNDDDSAGDPADLDPGDVPLVKVVLDTGGLP